MRCSRVTGRCAVLLLLFSLAACSVKRPKVVMSNAKMEAVLYDYYIARAVGEELSPIERHKRLLYVEDAFRKHGITQADFDTTLAWLARNPENLVTIYENVNKRLKATRDMVNNLVAMRNEKPHASLPGDSIDVWMWQHTYALTGMPLDNRILFNLPSDSNFQSRDTLRWSIRFRFRGALPDTLHAPVMAMQITYNSDSIISAWQQVTTGGVHTLTLQGDTLGDIKEVSGFVYYPKQLASQTLLADRISLMRYHAQDTLFASTSSSAVTETGKTPKIVSDKLKPVQLMKP